jgi:hypothetical protein
MKVYARDDHAAVFAEPAAVAEVAANLRQGECIYIFRRVVPQSLVESLRDYLGQVGASSLPNYTPLAEGCANFHRMVRWSDDRSGVKGCYQLFSFFPWNHDYFDLFTRFREIYRARNALAGIDPDAFLGQKPRDGFAARLSFQFYPKGCGGLNKHRDPVASHQLVVPTLVMSQKGRDFVSGGLFVEGADSSQLFVDDLSGPGDVVYFNATTAHGVKPIDPEQTPDWLSFEGRWMGLFAVNRMSAVPEQIYRSADLGARITE